MPGEDVRFIFFFRGCLTSRVGLSGIEAVLVVEDVSIPSDFFFCLIFFLSFFMTAESGSLEDCQFFSVLILFRLTLYALFYRIKESYGFFSRAAFFSFVLHGNVLY